MLTLTQECLVNNRKEWEEAGYALPHYDRIEMARETARNPKWIHFGAGNIFRAFQANLMQKLLNDGDEKAGLLTNLQASLYAGLLQFISKLPSSFGSLIMGLPGGGNQ